MARENNSVVLTPTGRIDSSNAQQFEKELKCALEQQPNCPLVLDCNDLEYISSAGLRVLLSAQKRLQQPISLKDVSSEVYEILDMTGFTSFMDVERKLREIGIEGCEVIGRGATATVYRVDPDTIVKVYEIPNALDMIKNEQRRAKQAFLKGIPTAISYDAVRVGDRYGSVFELLNAKTFVDLLISEPDRTDELIQQHVGIIRTIHSIEADPGELPDSREIYLDYLKEIGEDIPPDLCQHLEKRFREMPEDLHIIHGDIHMKNVMLCGTEPLLIDMDTLSTGNPVFDLADLFVAYMAFNEDDPTNSQRFIGIPMDVSKELLEKTVASYLETSDEDTLRQTMKRIKAVGYVRFLYLLAVMRMGGEELIDIRIRHTVAHLNELLAEVDGFSI